MLDPPLHLLSTLLYTQYKYVIFMYCVLDGRVNTIRGPRKLGTYLSGNDTGTMCKYNK